jgi:hypothetical protein
MNSATNLTFDILGHIFDHYAKTETIAHPLETLLLVSRSWSDAALGHRALWSHLNIHIDVAGRYPSPRIWRARLPLRLKRCGDTVPLHVDLRHLPSRLHQEVAQSGYWDRLHRQVNGSWNCPTRGNTNPEAPCTCVRETRLCIDEFFLLLAGQGGELCKRWSTLNLDLHNPVDYGVIYKRLGSFLRYPTPILTSATVHAVLHGSGEGIFPYTPLLQQLAIVHWAGSLPSLRSIRSLSILRSYHWGMFFIPDEASNIEELVLEGSFRLPKSLPNLWRLHVAGALYRPDNEVLKLPKLTHLVLKNHGPHRPDALGQGKGIDLSQLVALAVHLDLEYNYSTFKINVREILRRSKNLSILQGNSKGISMVLKLVWETEGEWNETRDNARREWKEVRLLAGQRISVEVKDESAMLSGDETCQQLCDVAAKLKVDPPDVGWDDILEDDLYAQSWA